MAKKSPLPNPSIHPPPRATPSSPGATGRRPSSISSARNPSPAPSATPSSPTASPTPTCSPGRAASARPRPPASSPRRSTASTARRPTPCGVCEICQGIASGEDVDVLEIDGASNRKIDEIRDIRNNVQYRPARRATRSTSSTKSTCSRARRSTPCSRRSRSRRAHVKFIFATTEVDKVPITILSRCQRFDFAGISLPRIVERLKSIVEREGLQADPEALELVARRAGGSMRDAQSLLDQLLAFGGERLTADQVHHLLGTAGDERILGPRRGRAGQRRQEGARPARRGVRRRPPARRTGRSVDRLLARPHGRARAPAPRAATSASRRATTTRCASRPGASASTPSSPASTCCPRPRAGCAAATTAGRSSRWPSSGWAGSPTSPPSAQLAQWIGQVRLDPRAAATLPAPGTRHRARLAGPAPEAVKKKPLSAEAEPAAERRRRRAT